MAQRANLLSEPAPGPSLRERRVWVRRRWNGTCRVRHQTTPSEVIEQATIRDISAGGIGLVLSTGVNPGAILEIEFRGDRYPRSLLAYVAHASQRADRTWIVGCQFGHHLSAEEMRLLLED